MKLFKHATRIQIRFKDIDRLGHVNNANHITYFEMARVEYFRAMMGEDAVIDWDNEGLILAKVEMHYAMPIFLDDEVWVHTGVTRLGGKSFDMECTIVKMVEGKPVLCAKGMVVCVCYNYVEDKTIEVPALWREKARLFEPDANL